MEKGEIKKNFNFLFGHYTPTELKKLMKIAASGDKQAYMEFIKPILERKYNTTNQRKG